MKNKIYYWGIVSCLLIALGCIFKIQHWPWSGYMLVFGFGLFGLLFMPLALINSYRAENDKRLRFLYILAFVCVVINCAGMLFKILHWPGAGLLMLAIPLPFLIFLPAYLSYIRKDKQINYSNLLLVLFFFAYFGTITAFGAVRVSPDVINEYVVAAISQEKNKELTNNQIKIILNRQVSHNSHEIALQKIREKAAVLCKEVDDIKVEIMNVMEIYNNHDLWDLIGMNDNKTLDYPFFSPGIDELRKSLEEYRSLILSSLEKQDSESVNFVNHILNPQEYNDKSGIFSGLPPVPFVSILQKLEATKHNISLAEFEVIAAMTDTPSL